MGRVLPPILELYVVWHPGDIEGTRIAEWLLKHFRGTPYAGLVGGAVEVYTRSAPWAPGADTPRPLPCQEPLPHDLPHALVTVVVPIMGISLARAVEDSASGWEGYLESILTAVERDETVSCFPVRLAGTLDGKLLSRLGGLQAVDQRCPEDPEAFCRDISQQIAQRLGDPSDDRLTVFISHTKRFSPDEDADEVDDLVTRIQGIITDTHLGAYIAPADVQPGSDWEEELRAAAASSALLGVRTDLYAAREWCQREFLIAKQAEMPIVTLNAIRCAEERGSFLMDHVPVVGYRDIDEESRRMSIEAALNLLVDGALRREVWRKQEAHLRQLEFDWTPNNAPEPVTLIPWLRRNEERTAEGRPILVMHPDPPLGPDEANVIDQLAEVARIPGGIDVVTPRTYASRGGGDSLPPGSELMSPSALTGLRVGISVSDSEDLPMLGLSQEHAELAVGEIARALLISGASLVYGGRLKPSGFTQFLMHEVRRYGRGNALTLCLAAPEHQKMSLAELREVDKELGTKGEIICLDEAGNVIRDILSTKAAAPEPLSEEAAKQASYSSLRRYMGTVTDARVLVGGKLSKFAGEMPGVIEEAIVAIKAGQPLFVAAGFGGGAALVAKQLQMDDLSWAPTNFPTRTADPRIHDALNQLATAVNTTSWSIERTTLNDTEIGCLSASHRPGELASTIARGLARWHLIADPLT